MTLVSCDCNWLLICCGSNFAFFCSNNLSKSECSSAALTFESYNPYETLLRSTTSLRVLKEVLSQNKSNGSEATNGLEDLIVDRNGATNQPKEEVLGNITCCTISSKHSKAAFGTDLKHIWIFDLRTNNEGCTAESGDNQIALLAVACLEKRPVSLAVLSSGTFLAGEKAGFISKIELALKYGSRTLQKVKNFDVPVVSDGVKLLQEKSEWSQEKSEDSKNLQCDVLNHVFAPFDLTVTLCAGCVSSLLVQMKVEPNYEQLVALCDRDMKIKVYCYPDMFNIESILMGHTDYVTSCCFMGKENELLLSSSFDGTLKLWNICSGQCLTTVNLTASVKFINGAKNSPETMQNKEKHEKGSCSHTYATLIESFGEGRALVATKNPCQVILCHLSCQPVTYYNEGKEAPLMHTIAHFEQKDEYFSLNIIHCMGFAGAEITCVEKMNASNLVFVGLRNHSNQMTDDANGSEIDSALKNVQLISCLNSNDAGNGNYLNWKLDNLSERDIAKDKFGAIYELQKTSFFEATTKYRLDFETINPNPYHSGLFSANHVDGTGGDTCYFGLSPIVVSPKITQVEVDKLAPESGGDMIEGVDAEPLMKVLKVDEQLGSV